MKVRVCNQCGVKNTENAWNCIKCGNTLSVDSIVEVSGEALQEELNWKCKNCGSDNIGTDICSNCGKDKNFVVDESLQFGYTAPKQSKADEYYAKGWKNFWDGYGEPDKDKRSGLLSRAHGYLTMAYKAAGEDIEEKKGIAGLTAIVLTEMNECRNAEFWAKEEISINPTNVWARLAEYPIALDKLVGHKGFVASNDGSGFGLFANILTVGVDFGRVQGKKNAVYRAAMEAGKTVENRAQTDKDPEPFEWLIWSMFILRIIENMWQNNMKEPYLCNVLLNLPWNRFTDEQINDIQDAIEEIQVEAHGFLGRLK